MALAGTPSTTEITESLPENKQGVASAVNDTSRELGSALGIAILGSILNERYREGMATAVHGLPAPLADGAQSSIAFTQSEGLDRFGSAGDQLVASAQLAFVDGIGAALMVAAGIVAVAAIAVAILAPRHEHRDLSLDEADEADDEAADMAERELVAG